MQAKTVALVSMLDKLSWKLHSPASAMVMIAKVALGLWQIKPRLGCIAIAGSLIFQASIVQAQGEPTQSEVPGWGIAVDPAGDCHFSVAEDSLIISVPGSHHDLNPLSDFGNLDAPRVMQDAGDSFAIQVQVAPLEMPKPQTSSSLGKTKHSYVGAGLLLWKDAKNFARFERAANGETQAVFLKLEVFSDGEMIFTKNARIEDKELHLRILRSSRMIHFMSGSDGEQWETHAHLQLPLAGQLSAGVMAINATQSELAAEFAGFSVESIPAAELAAKAEVIPLKVTTKFFPDGITAKMRGYVPIRAELSDKSDLVTKMPEGVEDARFGTLELDGQQWAFALVEPEGQPAALYIDTNADGDLTNDPPTTWEAGNSTYSGAGKVELDNQQVGSVRAYRFDPNDPRRAATKNLLLYYPDFGTEAVFELDGKPFSTFYKSDNRTSPVPLSIDRDGNGEISGKYERVTLWTPFNFTGTSYVLTFKKGQLGLETAEQSVPQLGLPPNMNVGQPALQFSATKLDGGSVNFPGDYVGKLVMLDFWATWCGPCIAEIPNMKVAYSAWHDAGYEILGVSLDEGGELEKVKAFLHKQDLQWNQIYEGKGWQSSLGELHDVSGIPFVLLVDGDSGTIIETERGLRGPGLSAKIGEHLLRKKISAQPGTPQYFSAAEDFWKANVERQPDLAPAAAKFFAGEAHFPEAVPYARRACESSPEATGNWLFAAAVAALAEDLSAYEGICRDMAGKFEATKDARVATHVCKSALLRPGLQELAGKFEEAFVKELEEGQTAPALQTFRWGLRGLLAYRNGDAQKALEHLHQGEQVTGPQLAQAQNLVIRAMAQLQLGQTVESKESEAAANRLIESAGQIPSLNAHTDLLIARLLTDEYRQLAKKTEAANDAN